MTNICKRWVKAPQWLRGVCVFAYLFVYFVIPFNHTCYNEYNHFSNCTSGHCHFSSYSNNTEQNPVDFSSPSDKASNVLTENYFCYACFYSTTAKSTNFAAYACIVTFEFLPFFSDCYEAVFVKQIDWLSSCPSRAPPYFIS